MCFFLNTLYFSLLKGKSSLNRAMSLSRRRMLVFIATIIVLSVTLFVRSGRQNLGLAPVPGWENASRNLRDYVNETLEPHIVPKIFCQEPKTLLIMISSRPDNVGLRQAVRDTWGHRQEHIEFYFLIGETDNSILQHTLEIESSVYDDIIQERFLDTYNNLTLKSVYMLKLFTKRCANSYKFLMKANDDVYINVPELLKTLAPRSNDENVLLGKVIHNHSPYRGSHEKWYMPYLWYPNDTYPDFICGTGYVMSVDVAKNLYSGALRTPLLHCEDVFLTGICAKIMNITPIHNDYFTCSRGSKYFNLCNYENIITFHPCTEADIRDPDQFGNAGQCYKSKELTVVMQWIFFLDMP